MKPATKKVNAVRFKSPSALDEIDGLIDNMRAAVQRDTLARAGVQLALSDSEVHFTPAQFTATQVAALMAERVASEAALRQRFAVLVGTKQ
jgi:hypothetical protein